MKKIMSVFILGAGLLVFAGDVLASGGGSGSGSGSGGGSGAGAGAGAGGGAGAGAGAGAGEGGAGGGNTNPVGNWMSPTIDYPAASVSTGEAVTVIAPSGTTVIVTPSASPTLVYPVPSFAGVCPDLDS